MAIVRGFIPWIVYAVIAGVNDTSWKWGAVAAVVVGVALILDNRRRGVAPDAQILEISAVVFFVVVAVIGFVVRSSDFHEYDSVFAFAWLASTAWASLGLGKPFTEGIAKQEVPREYWGTEKFKRVNQVITTAWALAFTITAVALWVVYDRNLGDTADAIVQAVGFIIPISFTKWYRSRATDADEAQAGA
ncbi:hypothetical protein [Gordonia sp. (in: high G+C Gram-positive bacteria)]|uniref:hypothetical protein n=1 Tax=Gordonia sp. (in: high G+C Gram-positive bacteria) TaxID=84139 RepID=UPI0039E6610C